MTLSAARMQVGVRALFLSDLHLGCRHAQADAFLQFLNRWQPDRLYLVGDFIDGWKLQRRWRWTPAYNRIFMRLLAMADRGTRLCYAPGNHDEFLRDYLEDFGFIQVQDSFIHPTATGERFLVLHGDQFDAFEREAPWLSLVSSYMYDAVLSLNYWTNRLRGKPKDHYALCGAIKMKVKKLVTYLSDFEKQLADRARRDRCQGIICGHTHSPRISNCDGVVYCNTGDWVENRTGLVEFDDGRIELVRGDGLVLERRLPDALPWPSLAARIAAETDDYEPDLAGLLV